MKCPICNYPNPDGATHCQLCQEVFNKSAAERYHHAQRRALRDQSGTSPTPDSPPANIPSRDPGQAARILKESIRVDWLPYVTRAWDFLRRIARAHPREFAAAGAIIALGLLVMFFTSPPQRLQLFGRRMEYRFPAKKPTGYLVGIHSEAKRWSERANRLDTPLGTQQREEFGNVKITVNRRERRTQKLLVQAREWAVTQYGQLPQIVPLADPSLKPASMTLDRRGRVLDRMTRGSFRVGRFASFLVPKWPARTLRTGAQWNEPVEWIAAMGDWKIFWRGRIAWRLEGTTPVNGAVGLRLSYEAHVAPSLWEIPSWARGLVHRVSFIGSGRGEAIFDTRTHQLYANDFLQDGALSIPLDDIYRIPAEVRVGRTPRRRYGGAAVRQPGVLIFQIKDKLYVRKS